jgi:hypothetical protein
MFAVIRRSDGFTSMGELWDRSNELLPIKWECDQSGNTNEFTGYRDNNNPSISSGYPRTQRYAISSIDIRKYQLCSSGSRPIREWRYLHSE